MRDLSAPFVGVRVDEELTYFLENRPSASNLFCFNGEVNGDVIRLVIDI